ncbi:MAG: tRNA pseudouridine(55) synthase, partial [Bacteroidetes bacterium]
GTYIRSIAHDLGGKIGVGAHLNGLIRTKIGTYHLQDAWNLNELIACF